MELNVQVVFLVDKMLLNIRLRLYYTYFPFDCWKVRNWSDTPLFNAMVFLLMLKWPLSSRLPVTQNCTSVKDKFLLSSPILDPLVLNRVRPKRNGKQTARGEDKPAMQTPFTKVEYFHMRFGNLLLLWKIASCSSFFYQIVRPSFECWMLLPPEAVFRSYVCFKCRLDWCCQPLIQGLFNTTLKIIGRWHALPCPL